VIRVKYTGPKKLPYILNTPIPYISHSDRQGEIAFTPEADVRDDWANFLLTECAGAFERVGSVLVAPTDQAPRPVKPKEDPLIYVGKRFSGKAGKWNAIAFIKKHKAETILGIRKFRVVDRVVYWELVPLALADVNADDMKNTWNTTESRLQKQAEQDSISVATEGVLQTSIP
jgi:hypothetical protein